MLQIKDTCYKGTRILLGNKKRELIDKSISYLKANGFQEISIPIIQNSEIFENKVGEENNNMMFSFSDRGGRNICLAPEYTAVIQQLSKTYFKNERDLKVFYITECFRGENPQKGRFRQFTQLGVEIINPRKLDIDNMAYLASSLLTYIGINNFEVDLNAKRGLDYYNNGVGFEISCPELGSSKQVCGGGTYDGGIGFAIGIDRILEIN